MTVQESILEQLSNLSPANLARVLAYIQALQGQGNEATFPDESASAALEVLPATLEEAEERYRRTWDHFPRDYPHEDGL